MGFNFNGTSGYVGLTPTAIPNWTNGVTIAAIVNFAAISTARAIFYSGAGASANASLGFGILASNAIYSHLANTERTGGSIAAVGQWLVAITKTSGTTTPRHHTWRYSTAAATQTNASGTAANPATAARTVDDIGRFGGTGDYFSGDIFIVGIWNAVLTDQDVQNLRFSFRSWFRPGLQSLWVPGNDGLTSVRDLAQREHSSSVNGSPSISGAGIVGFNWSNRG